MFNDEDTTSRYSFCSSTVRSGTKKSKSSCITCHAQMQMRDACFAVTVQMPTDAEYWLPSLSS